MELKSILHNAATNWVEVDVSKCAYEMRIMENARVESFLPKPPTNAQTCVDSLGVLAVESLHEGGDGVWLMAPCNQVEVVGHQAVGKDIDRPGFGMVA